MKNLTVLQKVYLGCLALAAVTLVSSLMGTVGINRQKAALSQMVAASDLLRGHMEADMGHDAIRAEVVSIVASSGNAALSAVTSAKELDDRLGEFETEMSQTKGFKAAPAVIAARAEAEPAFQAYLASGHRIANNARAGRLPDEREMREFLGLFEQLEGQMAKISDAVQAYSRQTAEDAAASASEAYWISLASTLMMLVVLFAIARAARRFLIAPILELGDKVKILADGLLDVTVSGTERHDEIGQLARSVSALRDNLTDARAETARQADTIVEHIGTGLGQLARGNLTYAIEAPLAGPFERLRTDFNSALAELGMSLSSVRSSTQQLHTVAQDIGEAAGNLSNRNASQAASLEETTAAITDLTQRVAGSSDAVRAAREAVDGVGSEVTRGGNVIHDAEAAMDRIEEASQEIGKIVSVIDGIAFQTNLLALNAGVEAARAGEGGKGFAVVANEVRALAQRSAEAASEIKDLIGNSSHEVGEGVRLVRDAGAALRKITEQMEEINRMMEVVDAGSSEQSRALGSINASSKQIEQITQSNAAVAEQVSQASHSVVSSVSDVIGEIDRFDLPTTPAQARQHRLAA